MLPEGSISPKGERAVRDLLRKRNQLVRDKTAHLLSIQNLVARNTGTSVRGNRMKPWGTAAVARRLPAPDLALAARSNLTVMHGLATQITHVERTVKERITVRSAFQYLLTVSGIGDILALTIMVETGDMQRFETVGNFASYCRCVDSHTISHGKRKGQGDTKNGNTYLAWAFVEAANFAVRSNAQITGYYQRKQAKTNGIVASKAVAHTLARACLPAVR